MENFWGILARKAYANKCQFSTVAKLQTAITSVQDKEQRWQEIFDVLSRFEVDESNWIWLGDFNARTGNDNVISTNICDSSGIAVNKRSRASKDVNMNVRGLKVLEYCADNDLIILNGRASGDEAGEFTFVSNRGSSVIDLGMVTPSVWNCIKCFRVESCFWSDHCPIVLYLEDRAIDSLGGSGTCYQRIFWDSGQLESLSADLWRCLEQTPNLSLLELSKVILDFAKVKGLTQRKKTMVGINDWFDLDCRLMVRARNRAWLEFKKNGLPAQRRVFVLYRSLVKKLCLAKKKEFCKRLQNVKNFYKNNRLFWNLCKARGNYAKVNISLFDWFSYFFSLYGSESPYDVDLVVFNDCVTWSNEILDSYISEEEFRVVLSKSTVGGAPGIDGIPTEFWKIDSVFLCLLDNFNKVLRTGVIPDEWKSSLLVPVPKGGSRLISWLNLRDILSESQAGFRADLASAFDSVDRDLLWRKLLKFGLSFKFVSLLAELYSGSNVRIKWRNFCSQPFFSDKGVKQGCILSPILFSLFLNDLLNCIDDSGGDGIVVGGVSVKVLAYADDVVIVADSPRSLQRSIDLLDNYLSDNSLQLNLAKSKIVVFRNGGKASKADKWWFRGVPISVVSQYKYLGVIFKSNGYFNTHVRSCQVNAEIKMDKVIHMCQSAKLCNLKDRLRLFNAVVGSSLLYASEVWGFQAESLDTVYS
ncbi:uncharacterized protein [Centruroides vittatus]|uniref:uncharacterized protein n=1 Tax=Centruroides vittatus TaxID=120091 RepID=UPI003510619F